MNQTQAESLKQFMDKTYNTIGSADSFLSTATGVIEWYIQYLETNEPNATNTIAYLKHTVDELLALDE